MVTLRPGIFTNGSERKILETQNFQNSTQNMVTLMSQISIF